MNRTINASLLAAALLAAASANAQDANRNYPDNAPVAVNTTGLEAHIARGVEREAAKGVAPLRQYVQRTRHIHQLDLLSLIAPRDSSNVAQARASQLGAAADAQPQR